MNKLVLFGNPLCACDYLQLFCTVYSKRWPYHFGTVFVQMHFFAMYEDTLLLLEISSLQRRNDIRGWQGARIWGQKQPGVFYGHCRPCFLQGRDLRVAVWLWAEGRRACYEAAFDNKQMFIYLKCCLIEVIWEASEKEGGRLLNYIPCTLWSHQC